MARPKRCRRVCFEPVFHQYGPYGMEDNEKLQLNIDEFEVIRLIDFEKKTHEQCAKQMDISRTTVTEIYEQARYKIADSLVNGKCLHIAGGHYRLYENNITRKGEHIMRIAVTYEDGKVFQHFGHTQQFKIYDVDSQKVVNSEVVDTMGSGHGALAGFLTNLNVDILICGGIGQGAKNALASMGIKLYGGVSGNADDVVEALLNEQLEYNENVQCHHHEHDHDHSCGEHHCGEDKHHCSGH
ncbi:MAG: DUF134 domain-containing protein [Longibaculum sp.]